MDIFETRLIRVRRIFRFIVPILFAAVLCLIFYLGIARTQTDSLEKEQVTLTQALEGGAIRTYALTGQYPQSPDLEWVVIFFIKTSFQYIIQK